MRSKFKIYIFFYRNISNIYCVYLQGRRIESPLQDALKIAKHYIEPRNSESLKKILSPTCAPDEEKQI